MSDRDFFRFFGGLVGSLVVLAVVLFIFAQIFGGHEEQEVPLAIADTNAIAERIKPVGEVTVDSSPVMNALIPSANAAGDDKGKTVYNSSCAACHATGVAGAPKLGDSSGWKARIAQGNDKLYQNAIKGFQGKAGFMPAKGGNAGLSDADVKASVDYMILKSK